jgi:V/A-type H+/Na+-transporting ATPase subunit C
MENTIFAQSIARIRFLETKMLDRSKLESLVEARDFGDCIKMLQDTKYGEYVTTTDYEEGLKHALEDLYKDMFKTTPLSEVVDILAVRYDAHNIKSLIKGKFLGREMDSILIDAGKIPVEKLKPMMKEENFRDLPKTLRGYVEKALEDFKNTQDPQNIDITIDRGMYEYMLEIAKGSELSYLEQIVRLMIDIVSIKSFIRIKLQDKEKEFLQTVFIRGGHLDIDTFLNSINDSLESFSNKIAHTDHFKWAKEGIGEYIKNGDLGGLERYGDNYLIEYLKKAKLVSFGPEPIIAYIIARENEVRALRIILTGKKNEVQPDIIKERLRDVYV